MKFSRTGGRGIVRRSLLVFPGGVALAVVFGLWYLTHQDKLDPQSFLEAVGWADKPGSTLIFPQTGAHSPLLPRTSADRRMGLANMLRSDRFATPALLVPGGQNLDATPVVFVHGLMSTPSMWDRIVRSIQSDPDLAGRFQFWFFYYPTGQPISLSALQLRECLDEAARQGRIRRPLILVGHSMGGIVSRAQAVTLPPSAAESIISGLSSKPAESTVRNALIFAARPYVARLVFIATPHRGTDFAYRGISLLGHHLIRLPDWLASEIAPIRNLLPAHGGHRFPTSIAGLTPGSPFLRMLNEATLPVPAHSIIPLLGNPANPFADDGVVPLWSSRIPSAESELLVAGDHGSVDSPESIEELRRILRVHAGLPPAPPAR